MRKMYEKDLNLLIEAVLYLKAYINSTSTWLPDTFLGLPMCSLEDFHWLFFAQLKKNLKMLKRI